LKLDETVTLAELDIVLEERLSRVESSPQGLLGEALNASLFLSHPYRRPVIGWRPEVEKLTFNDALDFYHRWYMPNNAIVVVAGDITPKEALATANTTYGRLKAGRLPTKKIHYEQEQKAPRRIIMKDTRVRQANWRRYYVAPAYNGADKTAYALDVLAEILGGDTGHLHKVLVLERKLALATSFWYDGRGRDYGSSGLFGLPATGVDLAMLESAIDEEIVNFLKTGITNTEVAEATKRLVAQAIFARDSLDGPARVIGGALATGQTVEDIEAWPERIQAINKADVEAAAKVLFRINRSTTGLLLPEDKVPSE
jgi:zinc protease